MSFKKPSNPEGDVKANWTDESAFNVDLALKESRDWIEAATREKFSSPDFATSTKNGVLLCKLLNQISANIIPKINQQKNAVAERENISFFLAGCKKLGLRETQLFTTNDLYEGQRLRTVAITLYWLGRAARARPDYKGPQLKLTAFAKMMCSRCKKQITGDNYVVTLDQQWHTECAACDSCSAPLTADGYYQLNDKVVCPTCYDKKGHGHGANDKNGNKHGHGHDHGHGHGHDHGNDCEACGEPLTASNKAKKTKDGRKACNDCVCKGCDGLIEGPFATVGKDKFCRDCLCDHCNHPFEPTSKDFKTVQGKKLCKHCRCADCDKYLEKGYVEQPKGSGKNKCLDCANKNLPKNNNPALNCKECSRGIAPGEEYYTDNTGKPICNKCKDHVTKPKTHSHSSHDNCAKCHKAITGPGVEALDKKWHNNCFNCDRCGKDFPDGNYVDLNDRPYCRPCANQVGNSSPKSGHNQGNNGNPTGYVEGVTPCVACNKPLTGQVAEAYGNYWHFGCFKCTKCKSSFTDGYYKHQNMPYCLPCFHSVAGTETCSRCSKPVDGKGVKLRDMQFHDNCFTCAQCDKNLKTANDGVYLDGNKPKCGTCYGPNNKTVQKGEESSKTLHYGTRQAGFTVDPTTGQKVIRCPKCQKSCGADNKFCPSCGVAITVKKYINN